MEQPEITEAKMITTDEKKRKEFFLLMCEYIYEEFIDADMIKRAWKFSHGETIEIDEYEIDFPFWEVAVNTEVKFKKKRLCKEVESEYFPDKPTEEEMLKGIEEWVEVT